MERTITKSPICLSLLCVAVMLTPVASAQEMSCGALRNNYGPYDYTNPQHRAELLPRVEQYHYDVGVRSLKGLTNMEGSEARLGLDISYTLRAFPNHHPALFTMIRYYMEKVPEGAPRLLYEPVCWFERAKRFAPADATVVMLEGVYFQKNNKFSAAKLAYETALEMDPDSAEINYNAGLFFIEIEDFERAKRCANKAYAMGHPLPGLRNKLTRLGVWSAES